MTQSLRPNLEPKFPAYRRDGRLYSPLFVPKHRRLETLAALIHCSSIVLLPCLYFYLWTIEAFWPFLILYTIYSYVFDNTLSTGQSICRTSEWLKNQFIFKGFVNFFPVITHRSVPLPSSVIKRVVEECVFPDWTEALPLSIKIILQKLHLITRKLRKHLIEEPVGPRYMFVCHPHGVISFGITSSFCWSGESEISDTIIQDGKILDEEPNSKIDDNVHTLKSSKSSKSLFPGIPFHLLTIVTQFMLPFYRDYIMSLGVGLVTKSGIKSILQRNHSVAIVVGGAHESLFAKPGLNRIVLNRRKGFIKIALQSCNRSESDLQHSEEELNEMIKLGKWTDDMSNMAVVPVYVYGENNIHNVYNTIEESKNQLVGSTDNSSILNTLLKFQLLLKKYTGFTLPLVNSRSIFNYDFGLLPYKRRLDVVFGEPIYIYRKFGHSMNDEVTDEEIDYYHNLYKEKLIELWEKNKVFATEWDEDLKIVE